MQSDMLMFTVGSLDAGCVPMPSRRLAELGILEPVHLERWIIDHPEVLGDQVKIVTTQYDKWSSDSGDLARERLDILGLDSSGQLVVVELKRGIDSRIHLQAITYAALVAGFSKDTLADAHADYLNSVATEPVSTTEALEQLEDHVDGTWDNDILTVPKIILLAEDFAAQTYTTVSWLSDLAPNLTIEMHTVNAFLIDGPTPPQTCIVFRRLYPAIDPTTRVLTPGIASASADSVAAKIAEKKRRIRSTYLLYETNAVPEGAHLDLDLHTWIKRNRPRGRSVGRRGSTARSCHLGQAPRPAAPMGSRSRRRNHFHSHHLGEEDRARSHRQHARRDPRRRRLALPGPIVGSSCHPCGVLGARLLDPEGNQYR